MKKIIPWLLALVLLSGGVLCLRQSFHFLPDDAVIVDAQADSQGLLFLVTDRNELYIGGHTEEPVGLYDWGLGLFGPRFHLRTLFFPHKDGAPMLFGADVAKVFSGEEGFSWLDTNGTLYLYTGSTHGQKIAENVLKTGGSFHNSVTYLLQNGTACEVTEHGGTTKIAENVLDLHYNSCGDTHYVQPGGVLISEGRQSRKQAQLPGNAANLQHTRWASFFVSPDGTLFSHAWDDQAPDAWQICARDVAACFASNNNELYYMLEDGSLFRLSEQTDAPELLTVVNPNGIARISGGRALFVIFYADGHYETMKF